MRFAAIDIGSNGIRFQVSNLLPRQQGDLLKRLEYLRFPIRLGADVFQYGKIGDHNASRLKKLMRALSIMLELFDVDEYMACATSAFREAQNGEQIAKEVFDETGIEIRVIDGVEEAIIINRSITRNLENKAYVHIDVGGGSTELNLYEGKEKKLSESFRLGTVRRLTPEARSRVWSTMEKWIRKYLDDTEDIEALGTGGNINKLHNLAGLSQGEAMSIQELRELKETIASTSMEDRVNQLQLNEDRADVIVPAAEIYLGVMERSGADAIIVPNLGLKDGIIEVLYERHRKQRRLPLS